MIGNKELLDAVTGLMLSVGASQNLWEKMGNTYFASGTVAGYPLSVTYEENYSEGTYNLSGKNWKATFKTNQHRNTPFNNHFPRAMIVARPVTQATGQGTNFAMVLYCEAVEFDNLDAFLDDMAIFRLFESEWK